jgi:hypothetical protein
MGELRMSAMDCVKRAELSVVEAAELIGLSARQVRSVWKRFKSEGEMGPIHGMRGWVPVP